MKKTPDAKRQARSRSPIASVEERKAKGKSGRGKASDEAPYRSPVERRAAGRTLRDALPRADHSGWKPPKNRRDPVEVVLASDEGRLQELVPIRHGRMMQSPFAFYRGTAAVMAADLAHTPNSGLRVQAAVTRTFRTSAASPRPNVASSSTSMTWMRRFPPHGNGTSSV